MLRTHDFYNIFFGPVCVVCAIHSTLSAGLDIRYLFAVLFLRHTIGPVLYESR